MNAIQAIATATTLQALCDALNAYRPEDHDGRTLDELTEVDMCDLPVFGKNKPEDTRGIYSYNDTHFLVPAAGEGYELEAREICYWVRQADGACTHQSGEPCVTLAEAEHDMDALQKNLGWTDLQIVRAEEINGSIHQCTVAWGLDAGDLCIMADVSEAGSIKISGAAETESWGDAREIADKIEFVQHFHGWANYAAHYQVWAHGNPEPLNYLVAEAAENETDE